MFHPFIIIPLVRNSTGFGIKKHGLEIKSKDAGRKEDPGLEKKVLPISRRTFIE